MELASIDAANYYDSTAHAIGSLISQSTGVLLEAVKTMLSMIQDMKLFSADSLRWRQKLRGQHGQREVSRRLPGQRLSTYRPFFSSQFP